MSITPEPLVEEAVVDSEREPPAPAPAQAETQELVVEDLLVEDISIDGMCGVY